VDRVAVFHAPLVIGGVAAPGLVGGAGAARLTDALRVGRLRRRRVGADLLVEADVVRA
jgi:riboflavin biosynthesis pyrimidine reductase